MTTTQALAFVKKHGIVFESARGSVPNLAEAVAGGKIRGSWWGHPSGNEIYALTRAVRDANDVLVCHLINGKITYVNRRLWGPLVRLCLDGAVSRVRLAALHEEHTKRGMHVLKKIPFPEWVPQHVMNAARKLPPGKAMRCLPPGIL